MDGETEDWLDALPDTARRSIESITAGMAQALDEMWRQAAERGDIGALVLGFLDGDVQFKITRYGVLVLLETPVDGSSVPDTPAGLS